MFEYIFAVVGIISITALMFAFVLAISLLKRMRYKYIFFNASVWITLSIYIFFTILAVYSKSILFYYIAMIFLMIDHIFLLIEGETLISDEINPWKLGFLVGWNVFGFMKMITIDNFMIFTSEGGHTISFGDLFWVSICVMGIVLSGAHFVFIAVLAYRKTPSFMKKNALLYLIGLIIITLVAYFISFFPPWGYLLSIFCNGLGALIISITQTRDPKLLFILKLKVFRLTVINTDSGVEMFNHNWQTDNELVDSVLFSGMVQGINTIMKESVKAGDITEIHLSDGIMLINRCQHSPVACILIAANTTRVIVDSFQRFSTKFYAKFQNSFTNPDVSVFYDAKQIIEESFPFIPDYHKK